MSNILETLNKIFTDEEFFFKIATSRQGFNFDKLMESMVTILKYYLATHDDRSDLSLRKIKKNYNNIKNNPPTDEHLNNIFLNGYLTHSFPGVERNYIEDFGFDYFDKVSTEERIYLQKVRDDLLILEQHLGECSYYSIRKHTNQKEFVDKEIFMTIPGAKTIYYSMFAPERLYSGPVNSSYFTDFPIVVGESKEDYLIRIIKYQIENRLDLEKCDVNILKCAEEVLNYYCSSNPCISFINISGLMNVPITTVNYSEDGTNMFKHFYEEMKSGRYCLDSIFTSFIDDSREYYNTGDLVTLNSFIDKDLISIIDFPDWYNLRQSFLKSNGLSAGTLVSYHNCLAIDKNAFYEIPEDIKSLYKKYK